MDNTVNKEEAAVKRVHPSYLQHGLHARKRHAEETVGAQHGRKNTGCHRLREDRRPGQSKVSG